MFSLAYNTQVVLAGTTMLGIASGVVGTFLLLRKRALVGDALSHAALPGVCVAFLVMVAGGGDGKWMPGLLIGGFIAALLGAACVSLIRSYTRVREDAALGIVLSVFFGWGVALLGVIQRMERGHAAGLETFIYGKVASMVTADATRLAVACLVLVVLCVAMRKELTLLCFNPEFGRSLGWHLPLLDGALLAMAAALTVLGMQSVGLILMLALLVIPAAAARFWTDRLAVMAICAAVIGALSCATGTLVSASASRLPTGAIIVVIAFGWFVLSLLFGVRRGLVKRVIQLRENRRVAIRQHLLRAIMETLEISHDGDRTKTVRVGEVRSARAWERGDLALALKDAQHTGRIIIEGENVRLTPQGVADARRIVRNHRLWEIYLMHYADVAASHVDHFADSIEHVIGTEMMRELERILDASSGPELPASPHILATGEHAP